MVPINSFELDRSRAILVKTALGDERRPLLLKDEKSCDLFLREGRIAGQFRCKYGFVLVLEGDVCVWESGADVALLSDDLRLMDLLGIHLPWAPGCVEGLRVVDDDFLEFRMIDLWKVRIRERPRFFPQRHEWIGWPVIRTNDFGKIRRYLDVDRQRVAR